MFCGIASLLNTEIMKQLNFQNELHFDFNIQKLVNHRLFVQSVNWPGIRTEAPQTGTTFSPIKHVGDTAFFDDLIVTLKLDEGCETWFEVFKWLTGLTRTESFDQFIALLDNADTSLDGAKPLFKGKELATGGKGYKNIKSTGVLSVQDANHQTYMRIAYMNIHPVAIGGFSFRTDQSNVNFMTYDVIFAYDYYFPAPVR